MAGKFFGIPFAATGDRDVIPNAVQPDGSVSYSEGFGFDYERPNTDPDYKPVPREGTNGLYYDITEALGIVQKQGYADWTSEAAPYAINASVRHNDANWYSLIATNSDEPGVGPGATSWRILATSVDTVNAAIATVAAASTINLTTGAPGTSQLVISGSGVSINNFTVEANRFFVVRFPGSCTLVNSANIVNSTGANITTENGSWAIIRATATNQVEVLYCGNLVQPLADVTASRAFNTTYTNTTRLDREVYVNILSSSGADQLTILIGAVQIYFGDMGPGSTYSLNTFTVKPGETYRVNNNAGSSSINSWVERG